MKVQTNNPGKSAWSAAAISTGLAGLIWLVFGQCLGFGFVNLDDDRYITGNAFVKAGISLDNIARAFTHLDLYLWSPVTTISHMLDCQLFGLNAAGHHFTNVLLHTATAILLFLVLSKMTGAQWRSAFVAAVFAIHPLRVESVAWVAERKDVLNGFFFALTLAAYYNYARGKRPALWYSLIVLPFSLGLLAKPMLASMPFLLLLLDYWPLNRIQGVSPESRFRQETALRLIFEKIPLLLIAAIPIAFTIIGNRHDPQTAFIVSPLPARLGYGVAASVTYIRQLLWPADAGVIHSGPFPSVEPAALISSAIILLAISGATLIFGRKHPYLPVGWCWYLGMLVPVSGVFALGLETEADRYTYLPQIGLVILLTWLIADLMPRKMALAAGAALVVVLLSGISYAKAQYWRDSMTLWQATLVHTSDNALANEDMGITLAEAGHADEAIPYYREALRIRPDFSSAHYALANALKSEGKLDEAISQYRLALRYRSDYASAHNNMGNALRSQGKLDVAATEFQETLRLAPDNAAAAFNLAEVLIAEGKLEEAIPRYRQAIAINPSFVRAINGLAWLLATCHDAKVRDGVAAVGLAKYAVQLTRGEDAGALRTLAAGYAAAGRFPDALSTARQAFDLAQAAGDTPLAQSIQSDIGAFDHGAALTLRSALFREEAFKCFLIVT